MELKTLSVVSLGGIIGSLSRWGVSLVFVDHGFPWATLLVNYVGAVLLTALVLYVKQHASPNWWWRPALGTGFCGGFTTYSAFALQIDHLLKAQNYHTVVAYSLASIIGTFILVFATNEYLENKLARQ